MFIPNSTARFKRSRQHTYVGPTLGQRDRANVGFECWANVVRAKCLNVGPTCRNVDPMSEYLQNYDSSLLQ